MSPSGIREDADHGEARVACEPCGLRLPALLLALAALCAAPGAHAQNTTPKADAPTLTGGDRQITLSWSNPSGLTGVSNRIRYREKGTTNWTYADASSAPNHQNFGHVTSATIPAHESFTMKDDTTYQVQLRHGKWGNYSGWGEWSDTAEGDTNPPPTLTVSSVEDTTATLTISYHDGSTWYFQANAGPHTACGPSSGVSGTTFNLINLTTGTNFTYKAYSNSTCTTELTTDSTDVHFLTKPGQATGLSLTAGGESLSASWTAVTGAASYKVQWKTSAQEWDAANRQTTSTTNSKTLGSLDNGTEYTVRVAAVNATGDGDWSSTDSETPVATLAGSSVEAATATLTISGHTGDWYYQGNAAPDASCSSSAVSGATTNLSNLTSGTSYTYKAYSDSACATEVTGDSTDAEFLTKPGQVTGVSAASGNGSLAVSWTAVTGAASYKVQWKSGAQEWDATNRQTTSTTNSKTLSTLTNQTQYTIRVAATNTTGDGAWSSEINGTPKAELTASSVEATTATLTLAGHAGSWYYQGNAAPDASCSSSAVTGATKDLTNLTTATSYTYKAYSDSNCATELTTDALDADFLTKPGQATGMTVTPGDGEFTVKWTAVTGATSYKIQYKSGAQDWSTGRQQTSNSTSRTIGGAEFVRDVTFTFRVAASNATGDGAWSAEAQGVLTSASLAASGVTHNSATLTLSNHSSTWSYRKFNQTFGDCVAVTSGYTVSLTGLEGGTSHEYHAYGDEACKVGLTKVSFTTTTGPSLAASSITHNSATITISNHSGDWYHERTTPSGGTCSSVVSTGTDFDNLSSLDSNTDYTWKAYSDSACTTELASEEFLTKPGTPTKPVVTNAGNERLRLAALISGDGTLSKWQYQQSTGGSFGSWQDISSATSTTLNNVVGNLTHGTTYQFKVRAVNATGDGLASSASDGVQPLTPTLTASGITQNSATLTLGNYQGTWYYKRVSPTTEAGCNEVAGGTYTANLTNLLSSATTYRYTAYDNSACRPSDNLVTHSFTTLDPVDLWVENIRSSSVVLSLRNWTGGDWSYKVAGGTASHRCVVARGGYSHEFHLNTGTSHTVTAYSGRNCDTNNQLDTENFTTLANMQNFPTLSASNVTSTGATLTIANHTGDWWYAETADTSGDACKKVDAGTDSATLSGLTPNTFYQYVAHSRAGCDNASVPRPWISDAMDLVTPGPITATVTDTADTWATLAVSGLTEGKWSYRHRHYPYEDVDYPVFSSCVTHDYSTVSVIVTGLKNGTAYEFLVHRGNTCNVNDRIVVKAHTFNFTAGSVGQSSATLKLEHYEGEWHHKQAGASGGAQASAAAPPAAGGTTKANAGGVAQAAPASGGCSAAITGDTATIEGLDPNTEYTWKAYKAAGCADADAIATATFATRAPVVDDAPSFGADAEAAVADRRYRQDSAIAPFALPEAEGGDGGVEHRLSPDPPAGLYLDPDTHTLSGTPTAVQPLTNYTWTATDADGDSAEMSFAIEVAADHLPSFADDAEAALGTLSYKQDRPITPFTLPAAEGGDGELTYSLAPDLPEGLALDPATRTVSGTPAVALAETGFVWTATDEDGDAAEFRFALAVEEDYVPSFALGAEAALGTLDYKQNRPAEPFTLPTAEGGDGDLAYSLAPDLPEGLALDAATRTISGTPLVALAETGYVWTATDEDGDAAELRFAVRVEEDFVPSFADGAEASLGTLDYKQNRPAEPFTLPTAEGGDGDLTYSLAPELPEGLTLDPSTRVVSGTPLVALAETAYVWTATDEDGDAADVGFALRVEEDFVPAFADGAAAAVANLAYKENLPIAPLILPEAGGGDGDLTYALAPDPPAGLTLDLATRTLSGTPRAPLAETGYVWTATDEDGDAVELAFSLAVEADFAPSFGAASIGALQLAQYVPMAPVTLPAAGGGDGDTTYELHGALPIGLSYDAATRTLSGTPMELAAPTSYRYTATDSDPTDPDAASLAFSLEVSVSAAEVSVLADALAAQGRALLSGATEAIGSRFRNRGAGPGDAADASAGLPAPRDGGDIGSAFAPWNPGVGRGAWSGAGQGAPSVAGGWSDVLGAGGRAFGDQAAPDAHRMSSRNLSFALPLGGAGDGLALWGATSQQNFDATAGAGVFNGSMTSLHFGADARLGDDWLAGAAVSHSSGTADYDAQAAGGTRGWLDTELAAVHPYVQARLGAGLELWAIGGWGSGEARHRRDVEGVAAQTADLDMGMAAAGLRRRLGALGPVEAAVVGGAGMLRLTTASGDRAVDGLEADVTQARLALELAGKGAAAPYLQVGARSDDAGSRRDTGLEVVGGLRYSGQRLDFEARVRWLSTGSGDGAGYEEYGGTMRLALKPRADGSGLSLNVVPSWGEAGHAGGLASGGQYDILSASGVAGMAYATGAEASLALDSELGYGFALDRGVLTLGATQRRDPFGTRELLGLTWTPGPAATGLWRGLAMRLGYQPPAASTAGGPNVELEYSTEF